MVRITAEESGLLPSHPSWKADLLNVLEFILFYSVLNLVYNTQRIDEKLNMQVFVKALKGRMKEVIINTKKELKNEEGKTL